MFFHPSRAGAQQSEEEVIMTVKRNYFPCVELTNLHIPLT